MEALVSTFGRPGLAGATGRGTAGASASQQVYHDLRRRIVSFALPPDTVLSRADLAKEFNVSLTPVREALQQLESEGLVRIFPQSRTLVTRLVLDEIREAHFLRIAVETEVVRHLAEKCPPEILKRLKTIVTMQEALADNREELASFQELDETFHRTMMAGIGHEPLHDLLRSRSGHLNRLRQLDLPNAGKIASILSEHRAILSALEAADPTAAQDAIRTHLSQTVQRAEKLQAQYPDYFS